MHSILEFITFEHRIEHDLEHDLKHKKQFSAPKIYNANGNLKKRWYVYYSFRNPDTDKLERQKNVYGTTNIYKTFEERMYVLSCYARSLKKLLEQGYSPYSNNTALHQSLNQQNERSKQTNINVTTEPLQNSNGTVATEQLQNSNSTVANSSVLINNADNQSVVSDHVLQNNSNGTVATVTVASALDYALTIKKQVVSDRTLSDYTNKKKHLVKWIEENKPTVVSIHQITKQHLNEYLNDVLSKTSPRNRNNFRIDLSSLFQTLKDNDMISENYFKKIPPLRSIPKRNRGFTLKEQESIFSYLEKRDPLLLLYIKFVSYVFLRPIEVCRIKVKDVDVINKRIRFQAKNSPFKTKILPQLLIDILPDLSKLPQENLLFSPDGLGLNWESKLDSRRDYFSKRFKEVIKDHFGFNENYGLYSFRHTYITKLYNELIKTQTPFAAKSELMLITGHTTMTALEKYLRTIDAELPKDYSDML
ncbi:phage integrase N-terminal SAM-like domain-containing protein [Aequorivita sp. SDUM287046]|uniref:Phage integrase N-terminal SAM-like domain-containing protein n=1 Tax=Aequorivita aurantiaca TaxID=3053356 RepID=A0ABT8DQC2_9FLAO|nr:phage integrase N-terminal SAM-like domain-containing protein [Aequorivita aurantiaca]MDN3725257.1 phage integrase N-terminal SAM-like domain-containing protein [Aequorivita aurantiaca]